MLMIGRQTLKVQLWHLSRLRAYHSYKRNIPSGSAVFPTVYIHLLTPTERGQTLDGQTINALLATFQVDVTTNTSKSDCRKVMTTVMNVFKEMRFQGKSLPETSINNKIHHSVARFSRVIGANDRLI